MSKLINTFQLFLILAILLGVIDRGYGNAQELPPKRKILVLHGPAEIGKWNNQFNSVFYDEMAFSSDTPTNITTEFLGLGFTSNEDYLKNVTAYLHLKAKLNSVHLVVGVLPRANDFLLNYGEELFPGINKIYMIPNSRLISKIQDSPQAVVVKSVSTEALKLTLKRIFTILPSTKNLVIVSGAGFMDRVYLTGVKKIIDTENIAVKPSYLVGLPMKELLERVSKLPANSAILFLTYLSDSTGNRYHSLDLFPQLSERANAPIFGFFDTVLGKGIVGGNLTSAELYAKQTAEISRRLLLGETPSTVSPITQATTDSYDWRQLKRWNIPEDRLPPGSIIKYRTETFWEQHKTEIIISLSIICLQAISIVILLHNLKQRKKAEGELRMAHDELDQKVKERTVELEEANVILKNEITERKRAEDLIKSSLKEKETLLKEIHHRVKNNMNVVTSLLKLHAMAAKNEDVKDALIESQSRIYAMSAVHETLHGAENLAEIKLDDYLSKISHTLIQTYSVNPGQIEFSIDSEPTIIDIEKASPLGLVINELISNSIKYAFPEHRSGEISVNLRKLGDEADLIICDDGVGMPEDFDWTKASTLGLRLVKDLVENQLDGTIELDSTKGTKFLIKFNLNSHNM